MTTRAVPSNPMHVAADEHGFLRVFATDREDVITRHGIGTMIGTDLDAEKVEVIDTKDIAALGLTTYLAEGYGIDADDLSDATEALNAIDGRVALIPTSAFRGNAADLAPNPPLRFVGIYAEAEGTKPIAMRKTPSSTLLPDLEPAPAPEPSRPVKRPLPIILIALALAAALVLWVAF